MKLWVHDGTGIDAVRARHGNWSAMSIKLSDNSYTRAVAIDYRLRRILQTATDLVGKPLSECRVLDLACLEGHYGIEFARHGATVTCVEIREANLAKTAFAAADLGLENVTLIQDDVRNVRKETYGFFDIIICSGILYHLPAADAANLIKDLHQCCEGLVIIDTYVALREDTAVMLGGERYEGMVYQEHDEDASADARTRDLWASIDNTQSFWFTHASLMALVTRAGFTSCMEVCTPATPGMTFDRRTYVALKGVPVRILTSDATDLATNPLPLHQVTTSMHPAQVRQSAAFKMLKRRLPPSIKDKLKPTLRRLGVIPPLPAYLAEDQPDPERVRLETVPNPTQ